MRAGDILSLLLALIYQHDIAKDKPRAEILYHRISPSLGKIL